MKYAFTTLALLALSAPLSAQSADHSARESAVTAREAATQYIARIKGVGKPLNAVIAINPNAPAEAAAAEAAGLPLQGKTVLVKDNIETRELPTTAGSLALKDNWTQRDAPMIANLRRAGGVVLGKANLSEWANIRDNNSTSGWSAVGGLTLNPHATDRNACGSSSGSGAAVAAKLAWAAIGTETNGSISCPASINGIVGFKPSVGIISRTHVVPISSTQDTAGPMARSVEDAAMLLTALAGVDPQDAVTLEVPKRPRNYTDGLRTASLKGVRIGVMRNAVGERTDVKAVFETALADMERAGAELVDINFELNRQMYGDSFTILMFELREDMGKYLRSLPLQSDGNAPPRSLADVIAFNSKNADAEMRWFGQDLFEQAEQAIDRVAYEEARANAVRIAGEETIDMLLANHNVQFLVAPTRGPAWVSDLVNGDNFNGSIGFGSPAAIAGYPHLTVPMGHVEQLPIGISVLGAKWSDHDVLRAGAAYERVRSAQLPEPSLEPWSPHQ